MCKTMMIVDDEQVFHDLYTEMLEETDYRFIHAYDGDEALEKLEEKKPDLILLDMLLDMVTGDTFFLYLKGMPDCADIPIIVLSSCNKRNYKNLLKVDPSIVFLDKGVTREKLIGEIRKKIGQQMLEWDDKFSVGISMIDEEHKKLIGILNKTFYVEGHGGNKEELREILEGMTDYALKHFKTEEDYMKEFNYPEYQRHKKGPRDFYI